MSTSNKRQSHVSSIRSNDKNVPRTPMLSNRTLACNWRNSDSTNKDIKKLGKELLLVKTCSTKYQQTNQKQLTSITPSVSTSKFSLKSASEKETHFLSLDGMTKLHTDTKPFTVSTTTAVNNTHKVKRATIKKNEKKFYNNFDKKYSIHSNNPLKFKNSYINRPDFESTPSIVTVKSELKRKKTSTNLSDLSRSNVYSSTSGNQISAWLTQCNNISTNLGEKNDAKSQKSIDFSSGKYINSFLSSHSDIKQSNHSIHHLADKIDLNEYESDRKATNVLNEFNTTRLKCLAEKFVNSNSVICSESTRLNDLNHHRRLKGFSNEHVADNEFNTNLHSSVPKYYDVNVTNVTDWASVSSSEWGDDMCEFDRQQSFRVHEMFEEIDRVLFDNQNLNVNDSVLTYIATTNNDDESNNDEDQSYINNLCSFGFDNVSLSLNSFEDKNSSFQNAHHLNSSVANCTNSNSCGIQDHLFYECKDWLSRFPHLRVVGKQIKPSSERESTLYHNDNSQIISEFSNCFNVSCTTTDSSLNVEKSISTNSRLNHQSSTPTNSIDEEIFAIDGKYENFIENDKTVNSKYNAASNMEHGKQLSSCENTYLHNKLIVNDTEANISKSYQGSQHYSSHTHQGYNCFRHKDREKSNLSTEHPGTEMCSETIFSLPKEISQLCFPSTTSINKEVLENVKRPNDLEGGITTVLSNSFETIIKTIFQHLWTDLIEWLKISLSANVYSALNKNGSYQEAPRCYSSPFYRQEDTILSRCNSPGGDAQNSFSLTSSRFPKQTKHSNNNISNCLGSQQTVHTNESSIELADLLQISTKTLQTREKSLVQENSENSTRIQYMGSNSISKDSTNSHQITTVGSANLTSVTMTMITTASRISPQPMGTISVNRPISILHNKYITNVPRKLIPTPNGSVAEIMHHGGSSEVGVIGIAANLHHYGKLAPLERLRTHLAPQYSSILEEHSFITTTSPPLHLTNSETFFQQTYTASLAKSPNLSISHLLSSVTVSQSPTPYLEVTTTTSHSVSTPISITGQMSSVNTSVANEAISSRNVILPPLSNPTSNSSIINATILFSPPNHVNTELSLPNSKIISFVINKTGFGVNQNSGQVCHQTPHLHKGISGSLVGQHNNTNFNCANTSIYTQKVTSKSSIQRNQNSPKQVSYYP
ncbi:pi3kinase [Schistosoma japonicum]|nr:pi3kinase [Schistosoma japonicum]